LPLSRYRTGFVATSANGAQLTLSKTRKLWTVHYTAAPSAITMAAQLDDTFTDPRGPLLLVQGNASSGRLVTHPLKMNASSRGFLTPKYERLRTITFEGFSLEPLFGDAMPETTDEVIEMLRALPAGCVRDPYFGLGLNWDLRFLTYAIEKVEGVSDLHIQSGGRDPPTISGDSYVIGARRFDDVRKAINRAHQKALQIADSEKRVFVHNTLLTALDPATHPERHRVYHKDAIVEAVGKSLNRQTVLSEADQEAVVAVARTAARPLSRTKPTELLELSRDIEIVTLETLTERLRNLLTKKLKESDWQNFFIENPFVLRLAFGFPITMVGERVSVGGRKFTGAGEKITDFAVKAAASGNLALIEIKTPQTVLIETTPYRGDVHAPSRELSAAVNQVLDQRYQLQKHIQSLKDNSGEWNIETYAVQCLIIAGRVPGEKAKIKSFELFRNGLKSVTVITFDELLAKLGQLHEFLSGPVTQVQDKDESAPSASMVPRKATTRRKAESVVRTGRRPPGVLPKTASGPAPRRG
jgi:Domain of unknown function (DUF4263)